MIEFLVRGIPVTQGSTRARLNGAGLPYVVRVNRGNLVAWRTAIAEEARNAMALRPALRVAVALRMVFVLPRPKSHYGKHGLLPSAPPFPIGKPDLDKLERACLDALKGVAYLDDAVVVEMGSRKRYLAESDSGPGLHVKLWAAE